jgi:Peptidase family S41/N-terminal domain of Peptidase_S41 in eukaryotic IRBP
MRSISAAILALSIVPAALVADPFHSASAQASAEEDAPIGAAEARETAAGFARLVEENYVFPDVAKKYAQTLRSRAARGEYDRLGTRGALAAALTRHVQAVHKDGHLKIYPQSAAAAGAQPQMMMVAPQAQQGPVEPAKPGPGEPIEEARWLAPGIAYIRFTIFPLDPAVTATAANFMKDHADARTVIFDVRTNKGGGMSQTVAMLPYLFDKETVLVRGDVRASVIEDMGGAPNMPPWVRLASPSRQGVRTEDTFVKPHPSERRLFDANVYVLTSNFTASAAEAFAFGLKTTGRATLIGERTTGGGHFAPPGQRVNDKFAAFVPIGRAYDPRTGKGWEGTGVQPDIKVPAEKALVEALVRSGIARGEAERLSASVHPQGPMTRPDVVP